MLPTIVNRLHRHLLSFALVGTTLAFVLASYAREGVTLLAVLPTLATAASWHEAGLPLVAIALTCTLRPHYWLADTAHSTWNRRC